MIAQIVVVVPWLLAVASTRLLDNTCESTDTSSENANRLFQVKSKFRRDVVQVDLNEGPGTCVSLSNKGSHFTVPVCVGTPPQCFDLVCDTGSDAVIIPSCMCQKNPEAGCIAGDKCFTGTNTSSSFKIDDEVLLTQMTFGSGTIEAVVATDVVTVGSVKSVMQNGVLLMVNRAKLKITTAFEGILGLGVPKSNAPEFAPAMNHQAKMQFSAADAGDSWPDWFHPFGNSPSNHWPANWPPIPRPPPVFEWKQFLKEADIDRFSICFRDRSEAGALRLGVPPFAKSIRQIGKFHWGIDFRGLSVGDQGSHAQDILFCGSDSMSAGMQSPCGILPDSGTTQIVGPKKQVLQLESSICDSWPRCLELQQEMPEELRSNTTLKSASFRELLSKCGEWLSESGGLDEIPSMHFHVKGADGQLDTFELTAWSYVTQRLANADTSSAQVCDSALGFAEEDYITKKNGPIWILGLPLFYEYTVGYDLSTLAVSLEKGSCAGCNPALVSSSASNDGAERTRWPRVHNGERRSPAIDITLPL